MILLNLIVSLQMVFSAPSGADPVNASDCIRPGYKDFKSLK